MPEDPKLTEFRTKNVELMQQVEALTKERDALNTKYNGFDPSVAAAEHIELETLKKANPTTRLTELETALTAEKAAHATTRKQADTSFIEARVSDAAGKVGVRPQARAFIVSQAAGQFSVENGQIKGTKMSPSHPGQPMSLDEWLTLQVRENAFAFQPSGGGGADPKAGGGSGNVREVRDPDARELGRLADQIRAGKVKVVYTADGR